MMINLVCCQYRERRLYLRLLECVFQKVCVLISCPMLIVSAEKTTRGSCGNHVKKGVVGTSEPFWCEEKKRNDIYFLLAVILLILQCLN